MYIRNIDKEKLVEIWDSVLKELCVKDFYLFDVDAHECSIQFRIAHYLSNIIEQDSDEKIFVDVEYNRDIKDIKKVKPNGEKIRPDIICHIRGSGYSSDNNIFCCEIKKKLKEKNNVFIHENDLKKIKYLIDKYSYKYGLHICSLNKNENEIEIKMCIFWKYNDVRGQSYYKSEAYVFRYNTNNQICDSKLTIDNCSYKEKCLKCGE